MSARGQAQRGAALLVGLALLLVVTILATSSVRFSMNSLRGAVNEELRVDAFHRAQSLIDATLTRTGNTAVIGKAGDTNCLPAMSGCNRNTLTLPEATDEMLAELSASEVAVTVRRLGPEFLPPPRTSGYSAVKFRSAHLQVESRYDQTADGYGRAELAEGVAVVVPFHE